MVVDQFEELFRYEKFEKSQHEERQDSAAFVELLLEVSRQIEFPVYIILTMRSEFLGNCTEFRGLPQALNNGQYLIPRMTREEKREAVTGPIAIGGATVTPMLVSRLLNDVGDNPDQLPILQHALRRTWDYRARGRREGQPLDLLDYEAIGTMAQALSRHAEEAYAELNTQRSRTICEKLFKLLIEVDERGYAVRRPARVHDICRMIDASEKEVIDVIDVFRRPGRTFLMPPGPVELQPDSDIDISHESLMRIWTRLSEWVKEEEQSAELYLRLAKSAALYEEGKVGLWRDPELMLALEWQEKNRPNALWAQRYDPSFRRAIRFLDASKEQKQREIAEKEKEQRAKIRRTTAFAVIITIVAIIAIVFAVRAVESKKEAEKQEQEALKQKDEANRARKKADSAADREAKAREEAEKSQKREEKARQKAEKKEEEAIKEKARAEESEKKARQAETAAKENEIKERIQGFIVDMHRKDADFRQYRAKAKELAVISLSPQTEDKGELKALLALTAYRLNEKAFQTLARSTREIFRKCDKNTLNEFDRKKELVEEYKKMEEEYKTLQDKSNKKIVPPEIFEALRRAYIDGEELKDIILPDVESWALAAVGNNILIFNNREGELFRASLKDNPDETRLPILEMTELLSQISVFQATCFAKSDEYFFCGTGDGRIVYWQKNNWKTTNQMGAHKGKILAMAISKNKNCLFYSVKNKIYMCELESGDAPKPVISLQKHNYIMAMSVISGPGPRDSFLVAGDETGDIYQVDISGKTWKKKKMKTGVESYECAFHTAALEPDRKLLVLGDSLGRVHLFTGVDCKKLASGAPISHTAFDNTHNGIVNVLVFSPGGQYLASAGMDGSIMLWDLEGKKGVDIARERPVITITGKQKILSLVFDAKGEYIIFSDERNLRICPTRPGFFYEKLCKKKTREFIPKEWRQYFGESIKQEDTKICFPDKE